VEKLKVQYMAAPLEFTVHRVQGVILNVNLPVELVQIVMKKLIQRDQMTTVMEQIYGIAIFVVTLCYKIVLHRMDGTIQKPTSGFQQQIALKKSKFIKNTELILAQLEFVLIL